MTHLSHIFAKLHTTNRTETRHRGRPTAELPTP